MLTKIRKVKISDKGIFIPIVAVFSIVLMALLSYFLTANRAIIRNSLDNNLKQQSFYFAEAGIHEAIGQLRQDPNNVADILSRKESNNMLCYKVTMELQNDKSLVIAKSTGYSGKHKNKLYVKTISALIKVEYLGDYFAASMGDLYISYPVDVSQGKVFGSRLYLLRSDDPGVDDTIKVRSATFYEDTDYDFSNPDTGIIISDPPNIPVRANAMLTIPELDDGLIQYYRELVGDGDGLIKDPNRFNLGGFIDPPEGDVPAIYFYDGAENVPLNIKGTINGKFIFVTAQSDIVITGDIKKGSVDPGLAGFIAKKNIIIHKDAPGADNYLEINGFMLVPYGMFTVDSDHSNDNTLKFNGGFMVRLGVNVADMFQLGRTYTYDDNLKGDKEGLPHMPNFGEIMRWNEGQIEIKKWEDVPELFPE
ncbi:MAG: hypothetical protein ABII27_06405 [bacterium]